MVSSMKRISASFLMGLAILASAIPKVHGQSHSMRTRPATTPRQFHSNQTGINRARPFFPSRPFGFDPFLRERLRFDPFLRREFGFDPFLRREFDFDPFLRRRFSFDPFLGIGVFGFPASAATPFFFAGLNGF